uniref:Uncharacterized protein n=1 Tax=Cacopsylla melanoneura TaxID=428564 RepID=A0A8D8W039_9HEMI
MSLPHTPTPCRVVPLLLLCLPLILCTLYTPPKNPRLTSSDIAQFAVEEIRLITRNISDPSWLFVKNDSLHRLDVNLVHFYADLTQQFTRVGVPQELPEYVRDYSYSARIMSMFDMTVEVYFEEFLHKLKRTDSRLWRNVWLEYCHSVLYDKNSGTLTSVPHIFDNINDVLMQNNNFYLDVIKELDNSICGTEMSPQQLIYNLYSSLQVTQVKAYVMMQFAWTLLHLYGKGNFTTETETLQVQFKQRLVNQMDTVKTAMGKADTVVYKCDPKVHVEGQTYAQLTQLLQGFLINEVDMNPKTSCTDNCGTYKLVNRQYGCFDNQFCARQKRCDGTIQNCQFYDADMTLCPSTGNASTTRRYDWIEYENGITLGKKSHCKSFQDKVDSWWRFWYHCSYCMCLCDARYSSSSHRYWSLRPVQSDIGQNKIIVGIRFIKLNKVVHIQIRQATLLPKLLLNTTTAEWVPVSKIDVGDNKRTVEGLDYHKMTYEKRALDLDDVILPAKYLVTGVQFRMLGSHLNLEIQGTAFNYETGQLEKGLHHKQSNDNTDVSENPRTQLNLDNLDVSTSSPSPSTPNPLRNSFILFTHSSLEDDVAQTTLPFIDIQPVSTTPLSPLSGVGVYHKGTPGYGGFVAPRLFTFDPTQYVVESEVRLEEQK